MSTWQPRRLLCFSAAFSMMAALCTALLSGGWQQSLVLCGLIACLGGAIFFLLPGGKLVPAALGLLVGALWCTGFVLGTYCPAVYLAGDTGLLTARVLEYPKENAPEVLYVRLNTVNGRAVSAKARLYLEEEAPDLRPGDLVTWTGTLKQGNLRLSAGLVQRGIYLTAEQTGELTVTPDASPTLLTRAARVGHALQQRIRTLLPGDPGDLLAAMLSSDRSQCSQSLQTALVNSGTAHLAAVSGLHLSILVGFFVAVLGKRWGFLASFPVILFYAAVAGCAPSALRAVGMQALLMLGLLFRQEYDPMTALFAALLVLTAQNPFSVLSPSLLLSFSATFGILWLSPAWMQALQRHLPKNPWLHKPLRAIGGVLIVSFSAMIVTLPLNLVLFGRASMISVFSNLLSLWAVGLSIVGGLLVAGISLLSLPAAAFLANWMVRWPAAYLAWILQKLGSLALAAGSTGSLFLEVGALLALGCVLLSKKSRRHAGAGVLTACFLLCLCFLFSTLEGMGIAEIRVYGNRGAPIMLVRDGSRTLAVGAGANRDYGAFRIGETLEQWNTPNLTALICLTDTAVSQGGLEAAALRAHPRQILVPKGTNIFYQGLEEQVLCFSQTGALRIPGAVGQAELIPLEDGVFALRWVSGGISIFVLYGGHPLQCAVAMERYEGDLGADVLLTDADTLRASHAVTSICARVQPRLILAADEGRGWLPRELSGIPVERLSETDGFTIRVKR